MNTTLQITKELGTLAQSIQQREKQIRTTAQQKASVLRTIYGPIDKYELQSFTDLTNITIDTFPRLVVYFLDGASLPLPNSAPSPDPILAGLPDEHHYRQVSLMVHPDKGMANEVQQALNAGFDLWKPYLSDPRFADVPPPFDDDLSIRLFNERGPGFKDFLQLQFSYLMALNDVAILLRPDSLTVATLYKVLSGMEEVEEVANADDSPVDDLIQMALDAPPITAGTKRARKTDVIERHSRRMDNQDRRRNARSPSETDESPSADDIIDPSLRRLTRSQGRANRSQDK